MPSSVFNADPLGKSTGQNTKLFLIKVIKDTDVVEAGALTHGLGFVPSWCRVTKLASDDQGTPILNTGTLEPMLDITASGSAGLIWFDVGGTLDLTQQIWIATLNTNDTYDAWFEVEVGRTHSRVK